MSAFFTTREGDQENRIDQKRIQPVHTTKIKQFGGGEKFQSLG
jgi:hypothetical protein